jgi:hypothetical protein
MRTAFWILLALTLTPSISLAQDRRLTAAAVAGGGETWDDEGSIGTGILAGGSFAYRLFGTTQAEVAIDSLTHNRTTGFFQSRGRTTLLEGSLVHRFGRGTAQPYVLGGLSVVHHSATNDFGGLTALPTSTNWGWQFGGGLAVSVAKCFEVGPEARFYIFHVDDDADPFSAYWIGVKVGVRF